MFRSDFILSKHKIIAESLISFESNPVKAVPESDWIFFTSKNSVRFFFKQKLNIGSRKVACVGRGTFRELVKHVKRINFIGDSVNVHEVGKSFVKVVKEETCLFPVSNISKRTIQKYFSNQSKISDLVVYNTHQKTRINDPRADVLIFTSPSNARAYFSKFVLINKQKVISIGPSTGSQLDELGILNYLTPKSTGELGLIDLI